MQQTAVKKLKKQRLFSRRRGNYLPDDCGNYYKINL